MKNSNIIGLREEDCKNIAENPSCKLFCFLPKHSWRSLEYKGRAVFRSSPEIRRAL